MNDERRVVTEERTAPVIDIELEEPAAEPPAQTTSIRIVEFGKLPTTMQITPGTRVGDLKHDVLPATGAPALSSGVDVYVNGVVVDDSYLIQDGDAVVGSPRVAGG